MKHFKHAAGAAGMTLVLGFWLFCYQLQMEGVGLTVIDRLKENGGMVLAVV